MSRRATGVWLLLAGVLLAGILLREFWPDPPTSGRAPVLPMFDPASVTSVQVRPPGTNQIEVRVERDPTNGWTLTRPFPCPAQKEKVEALLDFLRELHPATVITSAELRTRPKADEEYGFSSPNAASIALGQGEYRIHLRVGFTTLPGDQVFLQVVGTQEAYVVDAELLRRLPASANAWRDRSLGHLAGLDFDRVAVTNGSRFFELHRESASALWRMVRPLKARANHARIEDGLESLKSLTVQQFVTDDPAADAEGYGLQPPSLELAFTAGTNLLALFQFGGSPTNDPEQVFARVAGQPSIVSVPKSHVTTWRASLHDFRDPRLVSLTGDVDCIEVLGADQFTLERESPDTWRILPQGWRADPELVEAFLLLLNRLPVAQFVKDVAMETDLPGFGLATPARQFVLKSRAAKAHGATNDPVLVDLKFGFGTNREDRVYARRTDESFIYAVATNEFAQLPWAGWQLRSRALWNFTETDIARLSLRQAGRIRELVRTGPDNWEFAPGSQGVINDLAIEQTVRALSKVRASAWVAHGAIDAQAYGLGEGAHEVTVQLKNGGTHSVKFGHEAPSGAQYACITMDGAPWVFEFPWPVYRDVATYLTVP